MFDGNEYQSTEDIEEELEIYKWIINK